MVQGCFITQSECHVCHFARQQEQQVVDETGHWEFLFIFYIARTLEQVHDDSDLNYILQYYTLDNGFESHMPNICNRLHNRGVHG